MQPKFLNAVWLSLDRHGPRETLQTGLPRGSPGAGDPFCCAAERNVISYNHATKVSQCCLAVSRSARPARDAADGPSTRLTRSGRSILLRSRTKRDLL